jgi:hypothetical protein
MLAWLRKVYDKVTSLEQGKATCNVLVRGTSIGLCLKRSRRVVGNGNIRSNQLEQELKKYARVPIRCTAVHKED